ncbi:hypothetical protein TNCV_2302911 [Trichonephila clavipes]|nr:hypothetical protein TNCV_2302911 [Trichonephila clavipes]
MDSQLGDHGRDRSIFNDVINDESGCTNGETSFLQMNPGSAYSIRMVVPLFGGIVQDNARPDVASTVRTFLDTLNVRLLPSPTRSPDFSPSENVWSMVAE